MNLRPASRPVHRPLSSPPHRRPVGATVRRGLATFAACCATVLLAGACATASPGSDASASAVVRIGAVFPLTGAPADLAGQEAAGVSIAADLVNADGGVGGLLIRLDVRDLHDSADAAAVIRGLRDAGAVAVIGGYSSDLSIPASTAAAANGMVYWESGAVADQLTGRGLPLVFRVGANGARLGGNSGRFATGLLAPRLGKTAGELKVAIVAADDDYARSVADAAWTAARSAGATVERIVYELARPDWPAVMGRLAVLAPDVVILAAHIPDGEAFRRAMVAARLHVGALIGSTMAQCMDEFGDDLGLDAVGVFASDRPTSGFDPGALNPAARALYDRFAAVWQDRMGGKPTEEGLSGFTAAWALFHDVLPLAAGTGTLDATAIATAARQVDLPEGSLPNGAGLRFATDPAQLGQNERAAAVIWQWQAVRHSVVVWPPVFATGTIALVPLPS
jgi:branched-chain amino acid transport system substrate-binding protein